MKHKNVLFTCSHGAYAEQVILSAEMIIGPMKDVISCCLFPGMYPDEYLKQAETKLLSYKKASILVMADLFGGTPCNTMARLLKEYDMHIITGLNLGMLLEAYSKKEDVSLYELKDISMKALQLSSVDVNERLNMKERKVRK